MPIDADAIVEDLRRSRKYGRLCEGTLRRVAAWSAERSKSPKDALKRARRKLHQVYAAYLEQRDPALAEAMLDELPEHPDERTLRDACRRILELHASTRERMGLLDEFYESIFAITGLPGRVLDVGCGLNPFAIPWMGLPAGASYIAWEIDSCVVSLVNRFLPLANLEPLADCRDILTDPPSDSAERVDVAMLLKMLPCLEQQAAGCSLAVLRAMPARFVVVSFPTHSIGARSGRKPRSQGNLRTTKNMSAHYAAGMKNIISQTKWRAWQINFQEELVFVLEKTPQ